MTPAADDMATDMPMGDDTPMMDDDADEEMASGTSEDSEMMDLSDEDEDM